ncbi:acyl carrier protein [Actinomadura sp. ATCC 31491]|uniref:Acyl carrier protein n=1 Tax=Actinomadura luzonensis TaxID=2805427 RepID=A0ABT0GBH7_9ACTN|nr:acyl carrier protein [Actinomadura luzonensis]MCK2221977.1 acyl carrier protein [Actinomadura luzonensis]
MSDEELFEELRALCAKILSVEATVLTRDLDLREELEADSLDVAELAAATEDRFGVRLDLDTAKQARTLGDVMALVGTAGRAG